ncbi:hypothetical protein PIB30_083381, partial [Stylosanthes scabra]|nr:hypothetical protein [Stylosanthes scabra]
MGIEARTPSAVVQIEKKAPHSMKDDFLNTIPYKTISEIKDLIEKIICVTIGTSKDFTSEKSWWYKDCNNCLNADERRWGYLQMSQLPRESRDFYSK